VEARQPTRLAEAIVAALDDYEQQKRMASNGQQLMRQMFDVRRTALEIVDIYTHILKGGKYPISWFDSREYFKCRSPLKAYNDQPTVHVDSLNVNSLLYAFNKRSNPSCSLSIT